MARTPKARAADDVSVRTVYVTQSGPYAGQKITMKTGEADAAVADQWAVDIGEALAPNPTPLMTSGEAPQSYLDWIAELETAGETEPGPEPTPPPVLTSLSPDTAESGSADITMSVIGTGFTDASVIIFGTLDEPTTLVSDTEVTTGVKPSLFAPAPVPVSVRDAGGVSNVLTFTFTEPVARGTDNRRR